MFRNIFITSFLLPTLISCGAKPDASGSCELKCSNSRIGGNEYQITPGSAGSSLKCKNDSAGKAPDLYVTFTFTIERKDSPPTAGDKNVTVKGADTSPVGAVAFRPDVYSGTGTVLTSQDEWCTDTCGVASFTFKTQCHDQTVSAGIRVGSIGKSIDLAVDNADEKEAE